MATSGESTTHGQGGRTFASLGVPISVRRLSRVCHNVGTGLQAGVDIRRLLETEATRGSTRQRNKMAAVRDQVARGTSLAEAMTHAGGYFPPLVCDMVEIGEQTGKTEEVLLRLGAHFDQVLKARRNLLAALAWPMFEFVLAILVVGAFILIMGMIWTGEGSPPITVFGLYGVGGATTYFAIVGVVVGLLVGATIAVKNRWVSIAPLVHLLTQMPFIGVVLRSLGLSRLTWSLAIATETGLDALRAIELSVRTSQNTYFTMYIDQMKSTIERGGEMHSAFANTGVYPADFLDALQTGEIAGRISETMEVLGRDYEARAQNYVKVLGTLAGLGVLLLIGVIIISMIFTLFSQYLGIIDSATSI